MAPFLRVRGKRLAPALPAIYSVDELGVLALGGLDVGVLGVSGLGVPCAEFLDALGLFRQSGAHVLAHLSASCRAMAHKVSSPRDVQDGESFQANSDL